MCEECSCPWLSQTCSTSPPKELYEDLGYQLTKPQLLGQGWSRDQCLFPPCHTCIQKLLCRGLSGSQGQRGHRGSHLHSQDPALSRAKRVLYTRACHRRVGKVESMLVFKSNSPPHSRAHAFLHSDISTCVCRHVHIHVHTHEHTHAHTHRGYSLAEAPLGPWSPLSDTQDPLTCDVIHHHGHCGVPDVAGDQAAEPLLARCVPELQSHLLQGGR